MVLFYGAYGSEKSAQLGNFLFLSYNQKCPWQIRFEYSLILYLWNGLVSDLDFSHLDSH